MQTIYANVINLRLTPNEVVFEFGSAFPDKPMVGPPLNFQPDVRVVLNPGSIPGLINALNQAMKQQQAAQGHGTPPQTGPVN
jgi:hypothetical protein